MGPRRTRVVRRGGGGRRRKLVWATYNSTVTLPIAGATAFNNVDLLANLRVAGSSVLGCTVMRVRARIAVDWTGGAVADRTDMGILVTTGDMLGVASPADSLTDSLGRDWMFIQRYFPVTAGGAVGQEVYEIDLRAKRKIEELDQTLVWAQRHVTGAASLKVQPFIRTLIALP